jgi:formyltetrahydrofolate deformylase
VETYILSFTSPDGPGIIHAISGALLSIGANVVEQEQYSDLETGLFFARTRFDSEETDISAVRRALEANTQDLTPRIGLRRERDHHRALLMVSQYDHCLIDLLYRWEAGELPLDVVGIVSNHEACQPIAERHGLPFTYLPVTRENKPEQEGRLLELIDETGTELVILARYMQILSEDLCQALSGRVINIHHSFLPGFKGAKPYHQAYERGVKLIGATAHFVTSDLDEGPIIEQQVVRVTHAATPALLAETGRDVERLVLARAVRLWAEDRVFLNRQRTVVFGT